MAPESLIWSSVDKAPPAAAEAARATAGSVMSRSSSMLSSGCRNKASRWKVRGSELDLDTIDEEETFPFILRCEPEAVAPTTGPPTMLLPAGL